MLKDISSRRQILASLAGSLAAGCVPFEKTSPFWGTIGAGFRGTENVPQVSRAYAEKLPYASMLAWFQGSPKALLVLADIGENGRWTWASAERQSLVTFGPFVASLIGLDLELRNTSFSGDWSVNPLQLVGRKLERILDVVANNTRRQVILQSKFYAGGSKTIEIEGARSSLVEVEEVVRSQGRVRFKNSYWVEATTGRCLKSRQIAIPTLPAFNTEIIKYPA